MPSTAPPYHTIPTCTQPHTNIVWSSLHTTTISSPSPSSPPRGGGAQMPDAPDGNPSSCPLARDVWASLGTCRQGRTSGRISARCWLSLQRARGWTSPPWRLSHQCVCVDTAPSRVCVFPLWSPVVRGTCSLSLPARVDLWRLVVSARRGCCILFFLEAYLWLVLGGEGERLVCVPWGMDGRRGILPWRLGCGGG